MRVKCGETRPDFRFHLSLVSPRFHPQGVKGEGCRKSAIYKDIYILLSLLSPIHTYVRARRKNASARAIEGGVKGDLDRYFPEKTLHDARGNSRVTDDSLFYWSEYPADRRPGTGRHTQGRPRRPGAPLGERGAPLGQRVATKYGG